MADRITPDELDLYAAAMRKHGVIDFASGDTRIVIAPQVAAMVAPYSGGEPLDPSEPMRPMVPGGPQPRPLTAEEAEAAADDDLFASVA